MATRTRYKAVQVSEAGTWAIVRVLESDVEGVAPRCKLVFGPPSLPMDETTARRLLEVLNRRQR